MVELRCQILSSAYSFRRETSSGTNTQIRSLSWSYEITAAVQLSPTHCRASLQTEELAQHCSTAETQNFCYLCAIQVWPKTSVTMYRILLLNLVLVNLLVFMWHQMPKLIQDVSLTPFAHVCAWTYPSCSFLTAHWGAAMNSPIFLLL